MLICRGRADSSAQELSAVGAPVRTGQTRSTTHLDTSPLKRLSKPCAIDLREVTSLRSQSATSPYVDLQKCKPPGHRRQGPSINGTCNARRHDGASGLPWRTQGALQSYVMQRLLSRSAVGTPELDRRSDVIVVQPRDRAGGRSDRQRHKGTRDPVCRERQRPGARQRSALPRRSGR